MRVSVTTGARLHLGFTNLGDDSGRSCGSLGVALDRPTTSVVVQDAADGAGGDLSEHVRACVLRFCAHYRVDPAVAVTIRESIPAHVGLGSGTQLALAIGLGLSRLYELEAGPADIAPVMGRCRRSGIGAEAFRAGGFIIDAGHRAGAHCADARPAIVWRREFPADWRFVIAVPDATHGLSGGCEEQVFERLAPAKRISEEVCRLTQLSVMPALVEHDIEELGRALTAVDRKTGEYFSHLQGGVYGNGGTSRAIDAMLGAGAHGAGQSSWGPAVYGLVHERAAEDVAAEVRRRLGDEAAAEVFVCKARNTGALVHVDAGVVSL